MTSTANKMILCRIALASVFILGSASWSIAASKPSAASVPITDASEAAGDLTADASTDVAAMAKYASSVRGLLYERKFDQLGQVADSARASKERFAGGVWKLYVFYQGLKQPNGGLKATEEAWESHLAKLATWVSVKPTSATARIGLAEALLNFAAKLDKADQTKSGDLWAKASSAQHTARKMLKEAAELKVKCPHWYFVNLVIRETGDRDRAKQLFNQAISFEPTYFPYYRLHAIYLRPEWDGDDDEAAEFANEISKQIGGKQGAAIYFEIASALNCSPSTRRFPVIELDWNRIRDGHAALEELYGSSLYKLNQLAYLSVRLQKTAGADRLFDRIGDQWDSETWRSQAFFDLSKSWSVAPQEIAALRSQTGTDIQIPDVREYRDQFARELFYKFAGPIRQCLEPPGAGPRSGNDLFFRVAVDGTILEAKGWPETKFVSCIMPKLVGSKMSAQPSASLWLMLPAPPSEGFSE